MYQVLAKSFVPTDPEECFDDVDQTGIDLNLVPDSASLGFLEPILDGRSVGGRSVVCYIVFADKHTGSVFPAEQ